ncbi:hypothetical protein UC8_08210 [Roseimaritima ulvae]|uniref:Prenyltransferase and squalene oxidase repeat protein n=2 Tax=Roseimaritima ulvae TaxID=980254 RepID=A0A5B9QY51_9BACT|nr:hypothetical protein UC8_08210 [Roseimaritima ulvae]
MANDLNKRCNQFVYNRIVVTLISITIGLTLGLHPVLAQQPSENPYQKDRVDQAVDKAIAYLVSQQRENGAITSRSADTAMSSLAIMAMASVGHQPSDDTPTGRAMNRALNFVLQADRQDDQGYYGRGDGSRMYGHGIITLMLTEMLGMGVSDQQDAAIHDRLQRAIDLILAAQQVPKRSGHQGGWRYEPNANDADLSVSVWQVMALRSAKNDGLQVPVKAIDDAIEYLRNSYSSPLEPDGQPRDPVAGFSYTPGGGPSFAMTAAGLLAMQVCGQYESPLVTGAADWLLEHPPKWDQRFCLYGTYYFAQGMHGRGEEHAKTARQQVEEMLLSHQQADGSWVAENGEERSRGGVYGTSMAVLSLSVKYHYLPIYQR